ncbi:MAG TPA: DUF6544 family protein, partial [Gemmatimonadaceae bacterium]|nr:DUF6544 family protein [Gemmatimonadaceae bacterium]
WVNDALVMSPSLLLGPEATFAAVPGDPNAFDITFTDRGHSVKSRVFVDAAGAMVDFSTTDRFYEDWVTKEIRRGEWRTPISGYTQIDGHKVAGVGHATWHTTDRGEFTYVTIDSIGEGSARWNVAPGQ